MLLVLLSPRQVAPLSPCPLTPGSTGSFPWRMALWYIQPAGGPESSLVLLCLCHPGSQPPLENSGDSGGGTQRKTPRHPRGQRGSSGDFHLPCQPFPSCGGVTTETLACKSDRMTLKENPSHALEAPESLFLQHPFLSFVKLFLG